MKTAYQQIDQVQGLCRGPNHKLRNNRQIWCSVVVDAAAEASVVVAVVRLIAMIEMSFAAVVAAVAALFALTNIPMLKAIVFVYAPHHCSGYLNNSHPF